MTFDAIPAKGLYRLYLSLVRPKTAAPIPYHIASLTATLSAICSPTTELLTSGGGTEARDPLNLWFMLIGESGNYKSYPTDLAVRAVKPLLAGRYFMTSGGSKEGLRRFFRRNPTAFLWMDEAGEFFTENRAAIMKCGDAFWCRLYDGWVYDAQTKKGSENEAGSENDEGMGLVEDEDSPRARVTILAASATDELVRATRRHQWTGGICSRMTFIDGFRTVDRPFKGDWTDDELVKVRKWFEWIQNFSARTPTVTIEPEASTLYTTWFLGLRAIRRSLSPVHSAILNRLGHHALRIAAVYALSTGSATISADTMRAATAFADHSRATVLRLPVAFG